MFWIAICSTDSTKSANISREIVKCLHVKNVLFTISSYNSPKDMLRQANKSSFGPDILIIDHGLDEFDQLLDVALKVKQRFHHLTTFIIGSLDLISQPVRTILNPIFPISINDNKSFIEQLNLIYEQDFRNQNSFSYYIRPTYISRPFNEIMYFSSSSRQTRLVSAKSKDALFYRKLDEVENQINLKNANFIRINKSFLVNTKFISYFDHNNLILKDGTCLNISRSKKYKQNIENFFNNLS